MIIQSGSGSMSDICFSITDQGPTFFPNMDPELKHSDPAVSGSGSVTMPTVRQQR